MRELSDKNSAIVLLEVSFLAQMKNIAEGGSKSFPSFIVGRDFQPIESTESLS